MNQARQVCGSWRSGMFAKKVRIHSFFIVFHASRMGCFLGFFQFQAANHTLQGGPQKPRYKWSYFSPVKVQVKFHPIYIYPISVLPFIYRGPDDSPNLLTSRKRQKWRGYARLVRIGPKKPRVSLASRSLGSMASNGLEAD